ncbi:uncharacterized protein [Engystomops pustulosus]|uniref:uncharacterized protein n=1 Tax=Engystomops pustulosus TaxID=76066 RepID=UPI003AFA2F19
MAVPCRRHKMGLKTTSTAYCAHRRVKERPLLWNAKHKSYADNVKRKLVWIEICKKVHSTWDTLSQREKETLENDLRKRWRSCRDRFRREVAQNEKSGASPSRKRPYPHFEELLFLLPTRSLRPTQGNISEEPTPEIQDSDEQEDIRPNVSPKSADEEQPEQPMYDYTVFGDSPPQTEEFVPRPSTSRRGRRKNSRPSVEEISPIETEAVRMMQRVNTPDMYDGFGTAVAGQCRKLDETKRDTFMSFVMIIAEYFAKTPILPPLAVPFLNVKYVLL